MRQSAFRGALDDLNGQAALPDEPLAVAAAILAMTSDAVLLVDESWRFRYVNRTAERLLQFPAGELLGSSLWEYFPQAGGSVVERESRAARRSGQPRRFQVRYPASGVLLDVRAYPDGHSLAVFLAEVTGERSLSDSNSLASCIVAALPAATAVVAPSGHIVEVNDEWSALAIEAGAELGRCGVGVSYLDACDRAAVTGDGVAAAMAAAIRAVLCDPSAGVRVAYECVRPDGVRWYLGQVSAADGHAVVSHTDITAAREAEETLAFQARLLDMIGESVIATDPNGIVTYWNRAAERIFGWTAAEAMGRRILDLTVHPDGMSSSEEIMAALAQGHTYKGEFWARRRDGSRFPAEVTDTPVYGRSGELLGVVGVCSDITERMQAEDGMRALSAIVESSGDAIIGLTLTGVITSWNPGAERLYGYTAAEAIGQHISIVRRPDLPPPVDLERDLPAGRVIMDVQTPARRKDGSTVDISLTVSPVYDFKGILVGASGIGRDMTERRRVLAQAEEDRARLAYAQQMAHVGSLEVDIRTGELWWSDEYWRILGYEAPDNPTMDVLSLALHPDDHEHVSATRLALMAGGPPSEVSYRIVRPSGEIRWVRATAEVTRTDDGEPVKVIASILDVTELHEAEERRRAAEVRFRLGFDRSPIGMAMADLEGRYTVVNAAMCTILGRTVEEIRGRRPADFLPRLEVDELPLPLPRMLADGLDSCSDEHRLARPDGEPVWVEETWILVRDADGSPDYCYGQVQDVSARKRSESEQRHRAFHDPLTGLPNRLLLSDRIEHALARTDRLSGDVVVLFLDVDHFKVVNDGLGHAAGDALLVQLAQRLTGAVRPGDTLGRFGGDEFIIVCEDVEAGDVERLGQRIARAMEPPFSLLGREMFVTVSMGIAVAGFGDGPETVMRNADAAMYGAKARGRARAVLFDDAMHRAASARLDTEAGLRRALERAELRLHYQPLLDLSTGCTIGFEALVRWQHPTLGLIPPGEFVPVAEETGLIVPIGRWVLEEALRQVQQWRVELDAAREVGVSVNISARQLGSAELVTAMSDAIRRSGIDPAAVQLEVTETVAMGDVERSVETMAALRHLGVRLSIDDFGTGYSSLSYLKRLPVDSLKIDRSFIDGLGGSDPHDQSIVEAILGLANALGLVVVAEGVETDAQLAELRRLGVRLGQGFLWSRALPPEQVPGWLAACCPAG